jgi:hypothetical protein
MVGHGASSGIAWVREEGWLDLVFLVVLISLEIWPAGQHLDATQLLTDDNIFKENFRDRALFLSNQFGGFGMELRLVPGDNT